MPPSLPPLEPLRPSIAVPQWFATAPREHRPRLLQLPGSLVWFQLGRTQGCIHRDHAWIPIGEDHVAVPVQGPVEVLASGDRLLLQDAMGQSIRVVQDVLTIDREANLRVGLDATLRRAGRSWTLSGAPLSAGAERSSRAQPWATGAGLLWADSGWLYRQALGAKPQVLGPVTSTQTFLPGPQGSVLLGDSSRWTAVAGPGHILHPLPAALLPQSTRFDATGSRLIGSTEEEEVVQVTTRTAEILRRWEVALPLSGRRPLLPGAASAGGAAVLCFPPVLDLRQRTLSGPGGQRWDLEALRSQGEVEPTSTTDAVAPIELPAGWADLGITAGTEVGGHLVAWSSDGLLLARPTRR